LMNKGNDLVMVALLVTFDILNSTE
jgi:hypothetical protein